MGQFSIDHNGEEIEVKAVTVVVDPNKMSKDSPELRRLFDIVNEIITDIQGLVDIGLSNVNTILESAFSEGDKDKAMFALGGYGQFGVLGETLASHVNAHVQKIIPEMLAKGFIDFDDEGESSATQQNNDSSDYWNFGGM